MPPTQSNDQAVTMAKTASGVPVRVVPNGWRPKEDCLTLAVDELSWLDRFRAQLLEEFPEIIEDIIVYGYRARGLADLDLRMDVLVVIGDGAEKKSAERKICELSYDIWLGTYAVPAIRVLDRSEWDEKRRTRPSFYLTAIDTGISVL